MKKRNAAAIALGMTALTAASPALADVIIGPDPASVSLLIIIGLVVFVVALVVILLKKFKKK